MTDAAPPPGQAGPSAAEPEVDGLPGPWWIALSFVVYVALGLTLKSVVLNWIVGPLWLLITLHVLPRGVRALFGRGDAR